MKNDKRKNQKKELKKKQMVQMEESLRKKLFELVKSLGHDVVDVSEELVKMSRRLSKKLSKKMKNVLISTDYAPQDKKAKEAKSIYTLPKEKKPKEKKSTIKNKLAKEKGVDLPAPVPAEEKVVKPKAKVGRKPKAPEAKTSAKRAVENLQPKEIKNTSLDKTQTKTQAKRGRPKKSNSVTKVDSLPSLVEKKEDLPASTQKTSPLKAATPAPKAAAKVGKQAPSTRGRKAGFAKSTSNGTSSAVKNVPKKAAAKPQKSTGAKRGRPAKTTVKDVAQDEQKTT